MPSFSLNGPGLWYVTRATGIVSLLLLTVSVYLGVMTVSRRSTRKMPRFVTLGLHRNVSLLVVLFLTLHVATTVVDSYTSIDLLDAFVPFLSGYHRLWLGLGAVASDLLLALIVTSLVRERIGYRLWKLIHWLSYAGWPVALLHAWGTGTDPAADWARYVGCVCVGAVLYALVWRLLVAKNQDPADALRP
jgi:methionine sulfoxide reductase heme-binding subunit